VGPALNQSSYARVLHATLGALAKTWDVQHFAVNHRGAAADIGWRILPNRNIGDRYGVEQIPSIAAEFPPDAIFVFNSFTTLPRYSSLPARLGLPRPMLVAQCPLLGEAVDPRFVGRLAFYDCVVVLSETVRRHFADCFGECLRIGMIDRIPRLEVIPHGLDSRIFRPLANRRAVRADIPGLADLGDQGFVVLNANKNEPRKRIDITLAGFARFARDKPGNVRLYLHMGNSHGEAGLGAAIRTLGIADRVVMTETGTGHPKLDDSDLNRLYNACDVGINTASSEGWGMISFEHAATGAAQIVPGSWVCGEVWAGSAELLDAVPEQPDETRFTRDAVVTIESVASALERLYSSPSYRAQMASRAAALAGEPRFQWCVIAGQWDALLRGQS
jgi:glycosyltransferase involved in cell wall biosynthesis